MPKKDILATSKQAVQKYQVYIQMACIKILVKKNINNLTKKYFY